MRRMKLYVMLSALFLWAGTGCGIKEDRAGCPCRLIVDMSGVSMASDDSLELVIVSDSSWIYSGKVDHASLQDDFVVEIPRMQLRLMAWCGGEGMVSQNGLAIPLGRSCPKVYTHQSEIDADAEVVYDTLLMRKNHCVVSIDFKNGSGDDMKLTVHGNVNGYDEYGSPLEGRFRADAVRAPDAELPQVVLPRQCGGELTLNVEFGGRVKTFPLSKYIDASGYDWNAPDLEDLKLTIDIVHTTVSLSVSGWDEEFFFDIVI